MRIINATGWVPGRDCYDRPVYRLTAADGTTWTALETRGGYVLSTGDGSIVDSGRREDGKFPSLAAAAAVTALQELEA